jgi:hypothetical protein
MNEDQKAALERDRQGNKERVWKMIEDSTKASEAALERDLQGNKERVWKMIEDLTKASEASRSQLRREEQERIRREEEERKLAGVASSGACVGDQKVMEMETGVDSRGYFEIRYRS